MSDPIAVRVTRGAATESLHRVHSVLIDEEGREAVWGSPSGPSFWRSAMKPFQTLPLLEDGVAVAFDMDDADLALVSASHYATPRHVERVRSLLDRIGLGEQALICGPHPPYDPEAARVLTVAGIPPGRIHNNCSGKHAGMLALARHHGWPPEAYTSPDHPVQRRIRECLGEWIDSDPDELDWELDGCGVPTPRVTLDEMARAYGRLARVSRSPETAAARVVGAMTRHPELTSGKGTLPTRLVEATGGRLLAKEGAEAVFCVAGTNAGWGLALKVEDGGKRAVAPALLALLASLELLAAEEREALADLGRPELRNTEGRVVGEILAELPGGTHGESGGE